MEAQRKAKSSSHVICGTEKAVKKVPKKKIHPQFFNMTMLLWAISVDLNLKFR